MRRRLAPHFCKLGLGQRTPGHANTGTHRNWIAVCPGVFVPCRMRSPFATTPMRLVCGSTGGRHRGQASTPSLRGSTGLEIARHGRRMRRTYIRPCGPVMPTSPVAGDQPTSNRIPRHPLLPRKRCNQYPGHRRAQAGPRRPVPRCAAPRTPRPAGTPRRCKPR